MVAAGDSKPNSVSRLKDVGLKARDSIEYERLFLFAVRIIEQRKVKG